METPFKELIISVAVVFAIGLCGLCIEWIDSRADDEVRAPFIALSVGAISIGMGFFFFLEGVRDNALSRHDAWAWIALLLFFSGGGITLLAYFFRLRVEPAAEGLTIRGRLGASRFVPWESLASIYPKGIATIVIAVRPAFRLSIDVYCRGVRQLLAMASAHGVAVSPEAKRRAEGVRTPLLVSAFGALGVLIHDWITRRPKS